MKFNDYNIEGVVVALEVGALPKQMPQFHLLATQYKLAERVGHSHIFSRNVT